MGEEFDLLKTGRLAGCLGGSILMLGVAKSFSHSLVAERVGLDIPLEDTFSKENESSTLSLSFSPSMSVIESGLSMG